MLIIIIINAYLICFTEKLQFHWKAAVLALLFHLKKEIIFKKNKKHIQWRNG